METSASSEARYAPSSYPTIVCRRDADAVSLAEGSIQMTDNARLFGVAGVPTLALTGIDPPLLTGIDPLRDCSIADRAT